jgi:hypothetical protein
MINDAKYEVWGFHPLGWPEGEFPIFTLEKRLRELIKQEQEDAEF